VLLAVSGGLDSSALLCAAAATTPHDRLIVATFDHGTGPAATSASEAVTRRATELGLRIVSERATGSLRSEAELRDARWRFLREHAAAHDALIATAHTADDQVETVLMRIMRDAGARGLAGLAAPGDVIRPLLGHRRAEIESYARARGIAWIDDPSNESLVYLRNRVRHDILPALRHAHPSIDRELLAIGESAARWRRDVDSLVDRALGVQVLEGRRSLDIPAANLTGLDDGALRVLWPAVAARAGATLDRRALERLVSFARNARVGSRVPLAGGWLVVRARDHFELRRTPPAEATHAVLALSNETTFGDWVFRLGGTRGDSWCAWLPNDATVVVRAWRAGDRVALHTDTRERKVKELLTNAGVTGHRRAGWPVVLVGDRIVWVPGVGRSAAATARPGGPGLLFMCEYISR
jgi:tRNA(Ile)-lysidine synthase